MSNEMLNNWEKDWLPVPTAILNDNRFLRVKKEFPGGAGLGLIVATWLILKQKKDFEYPMKDLDLLADQVGTSITQLTTLILHSGFFKIIEHEDGQKFLSHDLNNLLGPYTKCIQNKKNAANVGVQKKKIRMLKQEKQLRLELQKAEEDLSDIGSTKQDTTSANFSEDDSSQHIILNNTILNNIKRPHTIKNNTFSSLHQFKNYCVQNLKGVDFYLDENNPFNYLTTTPIKIREGYLFNMVSSEYLKSDKAIELWNYLYKKPHLIFGGSENANQ